MSLTKKELIAKMSSALMGGKTDGVDPKNKEQLLAFAQALIDDTSDVSTDTEDDNSPSEEEDEVSSSSSSEEEN